MEGGSTPGAYNPRTVEEIFNDFKSRRAGMLKALTVDVEKFCKDCDPERENLCLYGFPDAAWEVNLPADEVPPELPEPALGINFARDGMDRKDWLSLVAVHSDAWLVAVAFFYGAHFDKADRKRLFSLINGLPTVFDVVSGRKQVQEKVNGNSNPKSKPVGQKKASESNKRQAPPTDEEEEEEESGSEEEEDEHGDTLCGSCSGSYGSNSVNEFWIGCDVCQKWYHGKCVKMTASKAEHIKNYKCPNCAGSTKRARQ